MSHALDSTWTQRWTRSRNTNH